MLCCFCSCVNSNLLESVVSPSSPHQLECDLPQKAVENSAIRMIQMKMIQAEIQVHETETLLINATTQPTEEGTKN